MQSHLAPTVEPAETLSAASRSSTIYGTYACLIVAMIVLQKFALAGGLGFNVGIFWAGLAWLAFKGVLEIVVVRLLLWAAVLAAMSLGLLLNGQPMQPTALAILIVMYTAFVVRVRVDRALATRCLKVFQNCMTVIAVVVLLQQLMQYTVGNSYWPNLDLVIPKQLQYIGFAYTRYYTWDSPYLEPNGVVFLEPSVVSAYLAMAFVLEVVWFRRVAFMALLLSGMLACLAGTGPATIAFISPFLAFKLNRRLFIPILCIVLPLVGAATATNWLDPLLSRSGELSSPNSSGYSRVTKPLQGVAEQISDPARVFSGLGPGEAPKGLNEVEWPFSKLLLEYGFLTAVLFHIFLFYCMFREPLNRVLSLALLIPHLVFGGGFVSHANVMLLVLLGSLLVLDDGVAEPSVEEQFTGAMAAVGR